MDHRSPQLIMPCNNETPLYAAACNNKQPRLEGDGVVSDRIIVSEMHGPCIVDSAISVNPMMRFVNTKKEK